MNPHFEKSVPGPAASDEEPASTLPALPYAEGK